ncbi:MAG: PQQ-dependent sugar dehydrogenase [Candidatus Andersenbacteria bacterium]
MKKILLTLGVVIGIGVAVYWVLMSRVVFAPTEKFEDVVLPAEGEVEIVAENLTIPWEIAWLPEGDMLVTERPGRLVRIGQNREVIEVAGVRHIGEGGLLGLTLHPEFLENSYLYLYLTTSVGNGVTNRVERYRLAGIQLTDRTVIIENIPGSQFHDGGRIAFGPDGYLYITTGDAGQRNSAQDTSSLGGKILRLNDDGSIPEDNPFNNAVYSYGHRNPQGLAWDGSRQLWATEHGQSGLDEVNRIQSGGNYGWPVIEGDEQGDGMILPILHSSTAHVWAPSGAAYLDGRILFVGLRGQSVYSAVVDGESAHDLKSYLGGVYGRLRTVAIGPDEDIYILTNNRDGRGRPKSGDDKIIRLNPSILK